jgi:glycine dehydrogenase
VSRSFEDRHIGPTSVDETAMLKHLGYSDLATFIKDVVPSNIAINGVIESALDNGKSEVEVIAELREIASQNKVFRSLIFL